MPNLCRFIENPTQRALLGTVTTIISCLFGISILAPTLIRLAWTLAHQRAILHVLLALTTTQWLQQQDDDTEDLNL